jgi:hypothetical protein
VIYDTDHSSILKLSDAKKTENTDDDKKLKQLNPNYNFGTSDF